MLRDFEAYWSAGSTWNARADAYGRAIWNAESRVPGVNAARDELLPFVGPSFTLPLWSLFARLPYTTAAAIWATILALGVLALAAIVVRTSGGPSLLAVASALALAVAFGPITSDVALGQLALLAFIAATTVTLSLRLPWRSLGSLLAFAQPNVAFGLVSQLGRNRTTVAMAIAAAAAYAVGVAACGWTWPARYVTALAAHVDAERFSAIQVTPGAIAFGAGLPVGSATITALVTALLALAIAVVMTRRISAPFARFVAVAPLAPFVSTFFHEHDLVVAYAAAGWCAVRTNGRLRAVALAASLLVAIDWLGLAQRPTGIAQSAVLAVAAALAFVALGSSGAWRITLLPMFVVGAVFVLAAWIATKHPAPIWPDALGTFHATATATASEVWREGQVRAGLLAQEPVWAFLRLLSLTGCALLSLCVYLTECHIELRNLCRGGPRSVIKYPR